MQLILLVGDRLIYIELCAKSIEKVRYSEIWAIKKPYGKLENIAKNVTLRFLAINAEKFIKRERNNFKIIDKNIADLILKKYYKGMAQKENCIHANLNSDDITNRF
jgi:hypothetical protein